MHPWRFDDHAESGLESVNRLVDGSPNQSHRIDDIFSGLKNSSCNFTGLFLSLATKF